MPLTIFVSSIFPDWFVSVTTALLFVYTFNTSLAGFGNASNVLPAGFVGLVNEKIFSFDKEIPTKAFKNTRSYNFLKIR